MADWGKLGGNHSMHSARGTATQKPGVSSQEGDSAISSSGDPQAGPPGAGFYASETTNKDHAGTQVPGQSAQKKSSNQQFAEGGKTPMFGNRGSLPAKAGCSAP
jgi:hypothetical protein